ncbi:MAG TPA: hypothetical protein PLX15_02390 [Candidatus Woesearchaeota archaeon]|nr:hypothetical protein [Candidatus Woesearchaeota archaeon]
MKKIAIISMIILLGFLIGCSEKSRTDDVNNLKEGIGQTNNPLEPLENQQIPKDIMDKEIEEVNEVDEIVEDVNQEIIWDDGTDDCSLLTVEDIKLVCGVDTVDDSQDSNLNQGQVCIKLFKTDDPLRSMKIFYTGDNSRGGLTPEVIAKASCDGMKAEMITEKSCYADSAGKSVFIYGATRTIVLANAMPMEEYFICSKEQLKQLGKLVSDRLD